MRDSKTLVDADAEPVVKIGAIISQEVATSPGITETQYLLVRVKPKKAGEVPDLSVPRGSRQYYPRDGLGRYMSDDFGHRVGVDARDQETGRQQADHLEPIMETLAREMLEEAGLTPQALKRAKLVDVGARPFTSRKGEAFPIHWFFIQPDGQTAATLANNVPEDATEIRWATLDEIKALADKGEFSPGYLEIIQLAKEHAAQPAQRHA